MGPYSRCGGKMKETRTLHMIRSTYGSILAKIYTSVKKGDVIDISVNVKSANTSDKLDGVEIDSTFLGKPSVGTYSTTNGTLKITSATSTGIYQYKMEGKLTITKDANDTFFHAQVTVNREITVNDFSIKITN